MNGSCTSKVLPLDMQAPTTVLHSQDSLVPGPQARSMTNMLHNMAWLLLFIVRDTSVSVVFSWVMTYGISFGSVMVSLSASKQTTMDFAISVLTTSKLLNWVFGIATQTSLVLEHPVVRSLPPTQRLITLQCILSISRKTAPGFIVTTIVLMVLGVAIYHVSPKTLHTKIHAYVDILLLYADTIAASVGAYSTVKEHVGDNEIITSSWPRRASVFGFRHPKSDMKRFAKMFCQLAPILLATEIAGLYAQFSGGLPLRSTEAVGVFALGSMALKICLQELMRLYVLRARLHNAHALVVIIGTPTIAIDTQMRIALLRAHSTSSQLSGAFMMAIVEVFVRFAKTKLVFFEIRHQERVRGLCKAKVGISERTVEVVRRFSSGSNQIQVMPMITTPSSLLSDQSPHRAEFERWKTRLLRHHAAEVYVDMLSEYMAMGCAYAVVVILWSHPKYLLGIEAGEEVPADSSSTTEVRTLTVAQLQLSTAGIQFVVEVAVDYVSSVLAAVSGVNLDQMQLRGVFVPVFLIWTTAANVILAANMLLRDDHV
ncbi:unnamed protein product [Phytophthora fragariaefolia]|uniref:Unnamed protein product n=1 Tax=Phytophthora fragariaefolia TaxID=1490495 RepID=A0A9W6X741_9STRA|nr:unnamed protein product [Phytophthora fragariaefolia]